MERSRGAPIYGLRLGLRRILDRLRVDYGDRDGIALIYPWMRCDVLKEVGWSRPDCYQRASPKVGFAVARALGWWWRSARRGTPSNLLRTAEVQSRRRSRPQPGSKRPHPQFPNRISPEQPARPQKPARSQRAPEAGASSQRLRHASPWLGRASQTIPMPTSVDPRTGQSRRFETCGQIPGGGGPR